MRPSVQITINMMCLKLEFTGDTVSVAETTETLVLVCPNLVMKVEAYLVVGTNTSIVRSNFLSFHLCPSSHKGSL